MVNWQTTATTVICEATGEEVTLIIDSTGVGRCTGSQRSVAKNKSTGKCHGDNCRQVIDYRNKIMAEETGPS